jgi:Zn-dependent protease with chaperone function
VQQPPARVISKPPSLRNPLEIPIYVICVVLNFLIVIVIGGIVVIQLAPSTLHALYIASNPLRLAVVAVLLAAAILWILFVIGRQLTRASVRGNSVLATAEEFPEIDAIKMDAAAALGFKPSREPEIYITNGNGVLNAFAASAFGHDFVTIHSGLFANTLEQNQRALRFIVGHELGHIRLHHTRLWYQLSIAFSSLIPLLGAWLSRLRELSCDRHGAWVEREGADGLVLLTAGRYIYHQVQLPGLLDQARRNIGFWNTVVQLPLSHPLTLRRIRELNRLGMIQGSSSSPRPDRPRVSPG